MKLLNNFCFLEEKICTDNGMSYALRLNAQHAIFQAHFPGNPITPGVCIIQMVTELLEQYVGQSLSLKRVANVKFLHVLSPKEYTTCRVVFRNIESGGSGWKIKASVEAETTCFAQLSLILENAPAK